MKSVPVAIAGVDGCKGGWIVVSRIPDKEPVVAVVKAFLEILERLPEDAIVAVDMPIGLPARTGKGGRGPETLARKHLGARQSSVFSIPSRAAVYAETDAFSALPSWYEAHRRASAVARATSEPPRSVSIQAFAIFPKIREIDRLLVERPRLRRRMIESHPEAAFWRLNHNQPMRLPKKIRGSVNPAGMEERKALLARHGFDRAFLDKAPPMGAAADDFLDACAVMLVAARRARGLAVPFPDPPLEDGLGIPVAIWT